MTDTTEICTAEVITDIAPAATATNGEAETAEEREYYLARNVSDAYRDAVHGLLKSSTSANTRRAYQSHMKAFRAFATSMNVPALPASPETVAAYVAHLCDAGKASSTINQAVAAIAALHRWADLDDPTRSALVRSATSGALRKVGVAPHKKAAATVDIVKELVSVCDRSTLQGKRDAAILLLGFCGAFRRSELVALDVEDFQETLSAGRAAYLVTVRHSKTDQESAGMVKGIFATRTKELDPVAAVKDYVRAAGITSGALFRRIRRGDHIQPGRITDKTVALVIKAAADRANISADLSGHSLRSGFITSALESGASERSIMNQSGHKSVTVMRSYQQRRDALADNAASGLAAAM